MEVYSTENEQVDAIRRFFSQNGKFLVLGIVLALAALFGWNYWQSHQQTNMMDTSLSYQKATATLHGEKKDTAPTEAFIKNNGNNYGVLAALQLAQTLVEKNAFADAEKQLAWAQNQTKDDNLKALVDIRLARVQLQENKLDHALKTLDQINAPGWVAVAQNIRGDVLVKKGDAKAAREAYSKGLASDGSQALQALLRIKLNNLSS